MGREEIVRTLQTHDIAVAKRKLHAVLADIQREIAAAEANRELPPESAEYVLQAALDARAHVDKGFMTQGRRSSLIRPLRSISTYSARSTGKTSTATHASATATCAPFSSLTASSLASP